MHIVYIYMCVSVCISNTNNIITVDMCALRGERKSLFETSRQLRSTLRIAALGSLAS